MRADIVLDKIDLACADRVRAKPTVNDSGFITYIKKLFLQFMVG